ncbi:helix-turn-helix domain-containing protein [Halobacterium rubrum]|uniref:helix-turn-helix domain-containing protein n=1 Tax=Halobacterium TaxID=2239 RepID=UPI001F1D244E|nr:MULTISPECIES: helix-turn-helix domain-containing protein [Halobacterium]MDH5021010.1 helix-turn-helix domain-containing protein [Halobacterium rubrum]
MKYVRARFDMPPDGRHPMHQFAVETDVVSEYELLSAWPTPSGGATLLLRFVGDADAYRAALGDVASVVDYHVSAGAGDAVYVYVRDTQEYTPGYTIADLLEPGLVVVPPLVFHTDGSVTGAFVGPPEHVQSVVEAVADDVSVSVEAVTTYGRHGDEAGGRLTDRQFEAVEAAVDLGYYRATREASAEDVGDRLGCSASTAAEHLRRAEATVMERVVDQ